MLWFGVVLGPFCVPSVAWGQALLLYAEDGRPGVCGALRIQMADVGGVVCETSSLPSGFAARIAYVSAQVRARGARIGLVVEPDSDPTLVRMLIIGARADQAVLAIERLADRPGPDVDRSLALKAREAHDVVAVGPELPLAAVLRPTPTSPRPDAGPEPRAAPSARRYFGDVVMGPWLGPAALLGGALSVGVARQRQRLRWETVAQGYLLSEHNERRGARSVTLTEWGASLLQRLLFTRGRLATGGALGLHGASLRARGIDETGATGRVTLLRRCGQHSIF